MEPAVMSLDTMPMEQAMNMPPGLILFLSIFIGILVLIGILMLVATCVVYSKAKKPWWSAIIPVYNVIVWLDIIKKSRHFVWIYLGIVGMMFLGEMAYDIAMLLNFIFAVWLTFLLAKKFGKGAWFTVGLMLLPFIFWPILAWGKSTYIEAK